MTGKNRYICGGIILLVCLACILPAIALELNPIAYIIKQPTPTPVAVRVLANPVNPVSTQGNTAVSPVDSYRIRQIPVYDLPTIDLKNMGITEIWGTIVRQKCKVPPDTPLCAGLMKQKNGTFVTITSDNPTMCNQFQTGYLKGNLAHVVGKMIPGESDAVSYQVTQLYLEEIRADQFP